MREKTLYSVQSVNDPLLDLIRLLRPRAALFGGGLNAAGDWGVSFRMRNDLLFCWIESGACLLLRPNCAPLCIEQGDFLLIRTVTPFTLASDASVEPIDSEAAVAANGDVRLRVGSGGDRRVVLHAGKFTFDTANEDLLAPLLPSLVHLAAGDTSLGRVRALLNLNELEARQPGPASAFVILRLVELILVEILRSKRGLVDEAQTGLLAGLADPVAGRALIAMHRDVAHEWTVAELAKLCGVSRSTFAARFRSIVGAAPIDYLLAWRMALAKDALRRGAMTSSEIAFAIGFKSPSAFSTAFTRAIGCSPKSFVRALQPSL
ncbi:AraC family transcriptional regulator [Methylocapsa sp. S129]|uniref:AraC family transcriptional regulator n=1 Tax=Methylocapsa sp. S129 TaxID=1641869 RepID=UPI00131D8ED4|nr:AraC family transcriptional regulator [Methylocapsa sp. S129]